jgi:uncharacterized membrane protein (DUF4010 family)
MNLPPLYLYLAMGILLTGWAVWDLVRYARRVRRGKFDQPFDAQNYIWFGLGIVLLLLVFGVTSE